MRLSVLQDYTLDIPVILVGNKTDQPGDRMVSLEEGQRRFRELSCACFHEISVRENVDQVSGEWRRDEASSAISNCLVSNRCRTSSAMCSASGVSLVNFPSSNVPLAMWRMLLMAI